MSTLKIDKSFMEGIPHDANGVTISRAIIALAHSLGLTLVAEGVETDAQLAFLRQAGCEVYQGWLFAKAMWPSRRLIHTGLFGVTESIHERCGRSPPQFWWSQSPTVIQVPAGTVAANAFTRAMNSAGERASRSCTEARFSPPVRKCTCDAPWLQRITFSFD